MFLQILSKWLILQRIRCAKGTWFENTKMSPLHVMLMTHCFTTENSYKQTAIDASVGDVKLSPRTISDWFNLCREVWMISMDDKYRSREKIGGYGVHRTLKHVLYFNLISIQLKCEFKTCVLNNFL